MDITLEDIVNFLGGPAYLPMDYIKPISKSNTNDNDNKNKD